MMSAVVSSVGMTALSDAFASIALPAGEALALTSTPLIGSAWRLSLNLGFVDDDHAAQRMGYVPPPKEWAASGARHPPLHVDVRFEDQVRRPLEPDAQRCLSLSAAAASSAPAQAGAAWSVVRALCWEPHSTA